MSGSEITTRHMPFSLIVSLLSATVRPAARGFPAKMERTITAVGGDSLAAVAAGLPVCVGYRSAASVCQCGAHPLCTEEEFREWLTGTDIHGRCSQNVR